MEGLTEIQSSLSECQQSQLLKYWDELREDEQKDLLQQLQSIDIKDVLKLYERAQSHVNEDTKVSDSKIEPVTVEVAKDLNEKQRDEYWNIGLEEIANGRVAVIVLAGGQATRLGLPFPKGMCPVKLPSGKTLFQIQAERIYKLLQIVKKKTDKEATIHWYLMTSEATHMLTERFLKQNKYFGLKKENVKLFKQAQIPCFDFYGKIILEEKNCVALAPDGNGGLYRALKSSGILNEMKEKGIKYVHVHGVDNILIKVADPLFIGKCAKDNIDCGVKAVMKTDPKESLGVICKIDNKPSVLEYSEVSKEISELKNDNGDLKFSIGNICNHFFTVEFLEKIANNHEDSLILHTAKKIITHVGPDGDKLRPNAVNGIKIEKFIFDVFPYSEKFLAWQIERSEEFSPVKNSDVCQVDCFSTAIKDLLGLHKKWVEMNGGKVKGDGVEISPLLSYAGEDLEVFKDRSFSNNEVILSKEEEDRQKKSKI